MLGKNQAKIFLRYYEQTLSNFSMPYKPSQVTTLFHNTYLQDTFVILVTVVKAPKRSSFF